MSAMDGRPSNPIGIVGPSRGGCFDQLSLLYPLIKWTRLCAFFVHMRLCAYSIYVHFLPLCSISVRKFPIDLCLVPIHIEFSACALLSLDVSFPKLFWLDRIQRKKIFCARLIFRLSRQKKWNLAVQILLAGLSSSLDGDLIESFCGLARQGKKWAVNLWNRCYMGGGGCFSSNILEFWCALSCIYFFHFLSNTWATMSVQ